MSGSHAVRVQQQDVGDENIVIDKFAEGCVRVSRALEDMGKSFGIDGNIE